MRMGLFGTSVAVMAWLACVGQAAAQPPSAEPQAIRAEVDRLRQEFEAIRKQYEDRLTILEQRLTKVEGLEPAPQPTPSPTAGAPTAAAPTVVEAPPGAAGAGGPSGPLPVYGGASASSKIFNPDIAVIGDFLGAAGKNDVEGVTPLELHEAEASFQAIVDPYARADFFLAFSPEGVEVEEGFITFTSLPADLILKAGKLRAQFGKVNASHNHALSWTDRPQVTRNLVGGEEGISDSGLSLSRLIYNPYFFLEATGEVYRGESAVFSTHTPSNLTYVGRLRGYHDVTENANIDIGGSVAYGHNAVGEDATSRLIGLDATFRYRPLRRAIYRRFQGRTELVWSRADQSVGAVSSFGMYASGEYQFARRWFAGGRYDRSERANDSSIADVGGSALVTFWPSEFSQIRAQYRRTHYGDGPTANEFLFQFLFSIGAHGAHVF